MSTFGHRGSRETGWNWSRPPAGPGRPPSPPPLLPLAGAVLLFAAIAAALLAVWLSDSGNVAPPPPTATPAATATHTATAVLTPTPAATAEPSPTPSPTPRPTLRPTPEPAISLAVWDGRSWQFAPDDLPPKTFREGQAVPFMLRIEGARPRVSYAIIWYTCKTLQFLSGFDRDSGRGPARAPGGPANATPDSTAMLPDDPATAADDGEGGRLSLWGGSFGPLELADVNGPCAYERSLSVKLAAGRDTLFLLWSAVIAPGAANGGLPVRVTVVTAAGERRIEIDPAGILVAP